MSFPRIISFSGKKHSGKSELCKINEQYGYININFADELKNLVCKCLNITREELETKKDLKSLDFEIFINKIIETYFSKEIDGRTIKTTIIGEKQKIITDENLLTHIMTNLISNAFKYSTNKPEPKLIINYFDNTFKIEIIDYGIGIPTNEKQYLFTSFFRASNTSTIVGTGLGLTIAKQFIQLLNGVISIESTENFGTTITVILPYGQ